MARRFVAPPTYVQTLQNGGQYTGAPGGQSLDANANYGSAVAQKYQAQQTNAMTEQRTYDPRQAATFAAQQQQSFQGGPAVSSAALGQAAYDQSQRNNLQAVGGQRGAGGQAQGLRAAMMGTTQGASAQTQAQNQAAQEQVAQRQAVLQQRLGSEAAQQQYARDFRAEKDRFEREKSDEDADTQSGIMKMASFGLSDERAKMKKSKRAKAPQLVIMLGGK